jgi:hypothetical protein
MLHYFFLVGSFLTSTISFSQTNYKETEQMAFNLLVGYQSFPQQDDIDSKLIAKDFTKLNNSPFTLGVEFSAIGKHSIGKVQFRGTSIFTSKKVQEMTNQSASISFQYGYDILPKASKTYLYPFAGIRYFNWTIFGKSTTDNKLTVDRSMFDFLAGFGVRQFLNDNLNGFFNNLDLNIGTSFPLTSGKWHTFEDTDISFINGTMKNKVTYFITLTIGRGFRPAH